MPTKITTVYEKPSLLMEIKTDYNFTTASIFSF